MDRLPSRINPVRRGNCRRDIDDAADGCPGKQQRGTSAQPCRNRRYGFSGVPEFLYQSHGISGGLRHAQPRWQAHDNFLQINRDTFIEMAPASANLPAGLTHIGLLADDANAAIARLREAGATLPDARSGGATGSKLSNLKDPNGIRLEIVEQPSGSMMRKAIESWK